MKLTKKEAQRIANNYRLGKIKKVIYLSEGWVNWNFKLETDNGNYVVQFVKYDKWKIKKMMVQFKLLKFLGNTKKDFPYKIPVPIKNIRKNYLMKHKNKSLWVYDYIEGQTKKKLTKKEFQEIAKAMALYHKYIFHFKEEPLGKYSNFNWIIEKYETLSKKKIKNKLDRLFVENSDFFLSILKKLKKLDYGKMIFTHSDFNNHNILFENGKLVGILDFDNLEYAPKIKDIAIGLTRGKYGSSEWDNKKKKIFINTYKKINLLSKKEESLLIPILIRDCCDTFWWFYEGMEKNREMAYDLMADAIQKTNKYLDEWKH
jgi:Ser/Thr protein kinase RdoA (MazF antagonist)|tara:strand:- start:406 stop:1353 length:948 start_codon:yes stop_codon:yes gene_type:complete